MSRFFLYFLYFFSFSIWYCHMLFYSTTLCVILKNFFSLSILLNVKEDPSPSNDGRQLKLKLNRKSEALSVASKPDSFHCFCANLDNNTSSRTRALRETRIANHEPTHPITLYVLMWAYVVLYLI